METLCVKLQEPNMMDYFEVNFQSSLSWVINVVMV